MIEKLRNIAIIAHDNMAYATGITALGVRTHARTLLEELNLFKLYCL